MPKASANSYRKIKLTPEEYSGLKRAMQWPEDLAAYDLAHQAPMQDQPAILKTGSTKRPRDNQLSEVYAWERRVLSDLGGRDINVPEFKSLGECEAYALPVWAKESGRLGLAGTAVPKIVRPSRGQRRALAHFDHRISLPIWSRSRWVILHEIAHRLNDGTGVRREAHGARFVGILIGLTSRWIGYNAGAMVTLAEEMGVVYCARSVGSTPGSVFRQ